jgi:hypothetical protein
MKKGKRWLLVSGSGRASGAKRSTVSSPKWRLAAGLLSVFGIGVAILGGALVTSAAVLQNGEQITICHATNSETNPYVVNTPAIDSIVKGEGHDAHNGPIWAPGDKAKGITWGDIIPSFDYTGVSGDIYHGHYPGKNWTAEGMAILKNGCEIPAQPERTQTTTTTVVFNAATNAPLSGDLANGGSVYDKATVTPAQATGTISYLFFTNGNCEGNGSAAGSGSQSNPTGPLTTAGTYSFMAKFTATGNFKDSTSGCEPFTVAAAGQAATTLTTSVFNAATNAALTGSETAGVSVYDTAKLTHSGTATPSGTVTYTFFTTNNCSGTSTSAGAPTLSGGSVANSNTMSSLAAGSYSFIAHYGGDEAFAASTSACEPFTIAAATTTGGAPPVSGTTPTPTGEILAETGANPPGLGLGIGLMLAGFVAMVAGALFWRRQRA